MFIVSTLEAREIKKMSVILLLLSLCLMVATAVWGTGIKGAKRWISILGFSLQPSEFAKPAMAVISAWLLSKQHKSPKFSGKLISALMLSLFVGLLALQPDIGMIVVVTSVWFGQLFLNGLPMIFVLALAAMGICIFALAYTFLPHVAARIDGFLDPAVGDHYQINRSLDAFSSGGLWGVGPGEGVIKKHLPDAHADFVFAVMGEEFGFFICVFVAALMAFAVVYGMFRVLKENNLFSVFASVGLLAQFGLQAFINMASALHIIPTKGMTLPFMSYGGSSMLALSISVGMILALGRQKTINYEESYGIT
jgi:cell division protein FtsW